MISYETTVYITLAVAWIYIIRMTIKAFKRGGVEGEERSRDIEEESS